MRWFTDVIAFVVLCLSHAVLFTVCISQFLSLSSRDKLKNSLKLVGVLVWYAINCFLGYIILIN